MPSGLGWLLAPVAAGWCRYESLKDGTLDLVDVAVMNDALAVRAENDRRVTKAYEDRNG